MDDSVETGSCANPTYRGQKYQEPTRIQYLAQRLREKRRRAVRLREGHPLDVYGRCTCMSEPTCKLETGCLPDGCGILLHESLIVIRYGYISSRG